jgi:hypothetical protein
MKYLKFILLACLTLACQQKKIADKDDATAELDSLHPDSEDFSIDEVVPLEPYSDKDTFVYTREVEGFLYVHMIYRGKNIPLKQWLLHRTNNQELSPKKKHLPMASRRGLSLQSGSADIMMGAQNFTLWSMKIRR